jgi:hypothetical protein
MNKKTFLAAALIAATVVGINAQVGINTDAPKTTLDIVQPDQMVKGQGFRLDDGNQVDGKVLTSDDDGIGTWKFAALKLFQGHVQASLNRVVTLTNQLVINYPGADKDSVWIDEAYIDLPAHSRWQVTRYIPVQCLFDLGIDQFQYNLGFQPVGQPMQAGYADVCSGPFLANTIFRINVTSILNNTTDNTLRFRLVMFNFRFVSAGSTNYIANQPLVVGKQICILPPTYTGEINAFPIIQE